jgi:hypothetical protein
MWLYILLAAIAIFLTTKAVERQDGPDLRLRFLETNTDYVAEGLKEWASTHRRAARSYVFPVLIPLGLLFAVFCGVFFATASLALAAKLGLHPKISWILAIFPALFVITKLSEGLMVILLLGYPARITEEMVGTLQALTRLRAAIAVVSWIQIIVLFALFAAWFV